MRIESFYLSKCLTGQKWEFREKRIGFQGKLAPELRNNQSLWVLKDWIFKKNSDLSLFIRRFAGYKILQVLFLKSFQTCSGKCLSRGKTQLKSAQNLDNSIFFFWILRKKNWNYFSKIFMMGFSEKKNQKVFFSFFVPQ